MEAAESVAAPGIVEVAGKPYMLDAKGKLVPLSLVKPTDKLIDETVRKIIDHARDLSARISRFRGHSYDDIGSLQALLAQEYGTSVGGEKGNITLITFDGSLKVQVQVADLLEFGPELQAAKRLVDECLAEWSAGSRDEIQAVVNRAFQVDKEGAVNRSELFMLLRVAIEDERWQRAMEALRDSIRVVGSKTYMRFYERVRTDEGWGEWTALPINMARA
ncbi:DUF3164 family protein [Azorhizobium caulinodans]|uniref:DUF3164 family protein n=1 Tax=Azorhizobium caulinodans TaxID=7 RepID=UPI002FBE39FC